LDRPTPRGFQQAIDRRLRKADSQNAVLESIAGENIGEAGSDNGLDAEIAERPGGMFAARSATKIVARDQDRTARKGGVVQDMCGIGPQGFECAAAKTLTTDRLEPFGPDDDVGVAILH